MQKVQFHYSTRFKALYPNLIPALEAITREAGSEGTIEAIVASQELLHNVLEGEKATEEDIYLSSTASADKFTGHHLTDDLREEYEVWCNGEAFGKSIIRQSRDAALQLAKIQGIHERYDYSMDSCDEDLIREQIRQSVQYTANEVSVT